MKPVWMHRVFSFWLALAAGFSPAAPARAVPEEAAALRPAETRENPAGLEELKERLIQVARAAGFVPASGSSASAVAPLPPLSPAAAGPSTGVESGLEEGFKQVDSKTVFEPDGILRDQAGRELTIEQVSDEDPDRVFVRSPQQGGRSSRLQPLTRHLLIRGRWQYRAPSPGSAAGLEEPGSIGELPREHRVIRDFTDRFLSGRIPKGADADRLLKPDGIPHPQLATQWIGVVTISEERVGAALGVADRAERRRIKNEADLRAQKVQGQVARSRGLRIEHMNFETKGEVPGGRQAGHAGGDLRGEPVPTISDVIEDTNRFVDGEPGSSSLQVEGPAAAVFGSFPDEARALMVVTHVDRKREKEVLQKYSIDRRPGEDPVDTLLDPRLDVDTLVRRVADLNGAALAQMDVFVLTSDEADIAALEAIQETYGDFRFWSLTGGTVQPSLAALLGVRDGRVRLFIRRSGMTEAVFIATLAGLFDADGAYANFHVVSEQGVKSGDSRNWYDWTVKVLKDLEILREPAGDFEQIRDGRKVFSSRQVKGELAGAYTFLTNGRTDMGLPFDLAGVRQRGEDSEIRALVFASSPHPGRGYLWLSEDTYHLPVSPEAGLEEPVNVALSVGGTSLKVGVLDSSGVIGSPETQLPALSWEQVRAGQAGHDTARNIAGMADRVEAALLQQRVDPKRLSEVDISWAGDGEYERGLVRNTKIAGFSDERYTDLKGLLEAELEERLGRRVPVRIVHDGAAGAIGEHRSPLGVLHGAEHGLSMILGTGLSFGVLQDGQVITALPGRIPLFLGEIGWHVLWDEESQSYFYNGNEVTLENRLPPPGEGQVRAEQRLAAPWIAARFVRRMRAAEREREVFGKRVPLKLDGYPVDQQLRPRYARDEERVLAKLTALARGGDAEAIAFLKQIGAELGQVIRVYREAYADQPFSQGPVAVGSTAGEKLGEGVLDEDGKDLFLAFVRAAAGSDDIHRSVLGHQREFAFATPSSEAIRKTPRPSGPSAGLEEGLKIVVADKLDETKLGVEGAVNLSALPDDEKREAVIAENPDILIVRSAFQVDPALLDRLPNLKGVIRGGHGLDNVDVSRAQARGVRVLGTGGSERSVAAWTLQAIGRARSVAMGQAQTEPAPAGSDDYPLGFSRSDWMAAQTEKAAKASPELKPVLRQKFDRLFRPVPEEAWDALRGKTVGIIGFGRVGKAIAAAARKRGMDVWVYAPSLEADPSAVEPLGARFATKEQIYDKAHFVVLSTGLYKDGPRRNVGMVDEAAVDRMLNRNRNLIALINPDREGLVSEPDIVRLIDGGPQYFADEIPEHPELRKKAVFTPHIAASTPQAKAQVVTQTAEVLKGLIVDLRGAGLEEPAGVRVLQGFPGPVRRVAFGREPDFRHYLAVASGRRMELVDWQTGARSGHPAIELDETVLAATISDTEHAVLGVTPASAVRRNGFYKYGRTEEPFVRRLPEPDQLYPHSLAFSPDRKSLLVTGRDLKTAWIQNLAPERHAEFEDRQGILAEWTPESGSPVSGAFHPAGEVVAVGTDQGTVELWRISGETPVRLAAASGGRRAAVLAPLFSPNGALLAAADARGEVTLWKWNEAAGTLTLQQRLSTGNAMPVYSVSFLPVRVPSERKTGAPTGRPPTEQDDDLSSRVLAAAGEDGAVRFWDADTGRLLSRSDLEDPAPIWSVSFSPDGGKIAAGRFNGETGSLALWSVPASVRDAPRSDAAGAGLEEPVVVRLIGPDDEERAAVREVVEEAFAAEGVQAVIETMAADEVSREALGGVRVAILTEFDEEAKGALADAHGYGVVDYVVAPDYWEERLSEQYELREELQGFARLLRGGLEELTTRRDFLGSAAAGAGLFVSGLPGRVLAQAPRFEAEPARLTPVEGARVKIEQRKLVLENLPAEITEGRGAALLFFRNDQHPKVEEGSAESFVWYVSANPAPVGPEEWHFPLKGRIFTAVNRFEEAYRGFRKGDRLRIVLLKDAQGERALREAIRGLPGHEGRPEPDTFVVGIKRRGEWEKLLQSKELVEKHNLLILTVDAQGRLARVRPEEAGGLEELGEAVEALKEFLDQEGRFWQAKGDPRRPLLIDASEEGDFRLRRLAQALSLVMMKDPNAVVWSDFRLVVPESRVQQILKEMIKFGPKTTSRFLTSRIISYGEGAVSLRRTPEEARREALRQLEGEPHVVNALTEGLALELRVYFEAGGLNFVSDEAFERLKALLLAA